jgi:hypothetical protein
MKKYNKKDISKLKRVLKQYPGTHNVVLYFEDLNKKYNLKSDFQIQYSEELIKAIESIVGPEGAKYC